MTESVDRSLRRVVPPGSTVWAVTRYRAKGIHYIDLIVLVLHGDRIRPFSVGLEAAQFLRRNWIPEAQGMAIEGEAASMGHTLIQWLARELHGDIYALVPEVL